MNDREIDEANKAAMYLAVNLYQIINPNHDPKSCMAIDTLIRAYQKLRDQAEKKPSKKRAK